MDAGAFCGLVLWCLDISATFRGEERWHVGTGCVAVRNDNSLGVFF